MTATAKSSSVSRGLRQLREHPQDEAARAAKLASHVAAIQRRVAPGERPRGVLDMGSGPGTLVGALRREGVLAASTVAFAVDPYDTRAAASHVFSRDASAVPTGAIDLVTLMMVLHHVPGGDVPRLLAQVLRVLCPGGLVVVREHDVRDAAVEQLCALVDSSHGSRHNAYRPLDCGFLRIGLPERLRAPEPGHPLRPAYAAFCKPHGADRMRARRLQAARVIHLTTTEPHRPL